VSRCLENTARGANSGHRGAGLVTAVGLASLPAHTCGEGRKIET